MASQRESRLRHFDFKCTILNTKCFVLSPKALFSSLCSFNARNVYGFTISSLSCGRTLYFSEKIFPVENAVTGCQMFVVLREENCRKLLKNV